MFCFILGNAKIRVLLAVSGCSIVLCCAAIGLAQDLTSTVATSSFDVTGRVISKTGQQIEVRQRDGKVVKIEVNASTDFALRLTNPWFDGEGRKVVVDGAVGESGQRERVKFSLPDGKLYLLAQFRSKSHRSRIINASPWRITNYLIGGDPIEGNLPKDEDLFLAGEVDLKKSALIIDGKSWPIVLGYRGATLRNRSLDEVVAGETVVVVSGTESAEGKTANTVLFMNR